MLTSFEQEWLQSLSPEEVDYLSGQLKEAGVTEADIALIEQESASEELARLAELEKMAADNGVDLNSLEVEDLRSLLQLQELFEADPDLADSVLKDLEAGESGQASEGETQNAATDTAITNSESQVGTTSAASDEGSDADLSDDEFVAKAAAALGQEKVASLLQEGEILALGFHNGLAKIAQSQEYTSYLYEQGEKLGEAMFDEDVKEAEERKAALDRLVTKIASQAKKAEGEGEYGEGGVSEDEKKKMEDEKKKMEDENKKTEDEKKKSSGLDRLRAALEARKGE